MPSFFAQPNGGEADLRTTYCAFVICSLLDDWSGMDLDRAIAFVQRCSVGPSPAAIGDVR